MKDLVDRARAAMNLTLVASVVLIWVSLQPPPESTVVIAKEILDSEIIREASLPYDPERVSSIKIQDFLSDIEVILSGLGQEFSEEWDALGDEVLPPRGEFEHRDPPKGSAEYADRN